MTPAGHGGTPPRWARALLRSALPPGTAGASVRADLDQEFRELAQVSGRGAARRWYAWEAIKLAAHFWSRGAADLWTTGGGVETLARNLGLAGRRMRRSPGFTLVTVMTLALGIGANVSIFSVVEAVLLEPLPYEEPDDLVALFEWKRGRDDRTNVANPGNFADWRDRSGSFARMTAVSVQFPGTLVVVGDDPDEVVVQNAMPDFFDVLGSDVTLGRTFVTDLDGLESTEVVLSERLWRSRFGGDPSVVGASVRVNGVPVAVVGVLPADYVVFGEGTDLWTATRLDRADQTNSGRWVNVVGRLAPGIGIQAARSELETIASGLEEEFPGLNAGWTVNLVPLKEHVVGDVRRALWILLGSVGLLLLIACANVANLFLVRATERQREMAVRTSLGASGRMLVGQLLVESAVIAGLGAFLGVGLAYAGTRFVTTRLPEAFAMPRIESAGVDIQVLGFAVLVTALTGLLFGLAPAVQAARVAPGRTLNAESRGPSRRSGAMRNGLVVAEVALSVLLLAGAALFVRSFSTLMAVDPGIEPEQVLVGRVNLNGTRYRGDEPKVAFFDELLERIGAEPGVASVGGITFLPFDGPGGRQYVLAGRPAQAAVGRATGRERAQRRRRLLRRDGDARARGEAFRRARPHRSADDRGQPDDGGASLARR